MAIISNTYFVNDLFIPQAVAKPALGTSPNNVAEVNDCINTVEREVLLNALGLTLYNELQDALPIVTLSDQKWKDLVNGVEYDGKVWDGLANSKSLLAYAVYFNFLDDNSSYWTTTGVVKAESENASNVTPFYKISKAYQTFIRKYQSGFCIEPYRALIDGWLYTDYYAEHKDVNVSLFEFLRDKASIYNWSEEKFKHYNPTSKNTFGL